MATLTDRVVDELQALGVPLDDDDLAGRLGVARKAVNQTCRRLAGLGMVARGSGRDGKIVNRLTPFAIEALELAVALSVPVTSTRVAYLSEDEVKQAVKAHLEATGHEVCVAVGRARGADIDATGPEGRIIIEATGEVAFEPQQVNYFLGALGELLQRMSYRDARYGLALPGNRQYRDLVDRLPTFAKERLGLIVYFVTRDGDRLRVDEMM